MPRGSAASGLQEIGLPYAADAAITRHMARFLRQQAVDRRAWRGAARAERACRARRTCCSTAACCTRDLIRERILGVLNSWLAEEGMQPVKPLSGEDLMHAVARGAAYYGTGAARPGRAHPRRRAADVLRRHRERHALRARHSRRRSRR